MTSVQQRGRHALADAQDIGSAGTARTIDPDAGAISAKHLRAQSSGAPDPGGQYSGGQYTGTHHFEAAQIDADQIGTLHAVAASDVELSAADGTSLSAPRRRPRGARRIAATVVLVLFLAAAVTTTVFALTGGRWFVVRTPSMGTTAPVGSLVLTRPVTVSDLRVGDVVAFHPTTLPSSTYTHRVVAIDGDSITTRGDINGANDPWRTTDRDLIGRTVAMLPGLGYAFRALPLLAGGGLVVWGITRWWVPARFRGPARMLGGTALYLAAALTIRPYVGVVQLAAVSDGDRHEVAAVSTGMLPVQLVPLPGHGTAAPVSLRYGEVGTAVFSNPPADGKFAMTAQLHLTGWDWAIVIAMWSLPLLWTTLVGFRRPDTSFDIGIDTARVATA